MPTQGNGSVAKTERWRLLDNNPYLPDRPKARRVRKLTPGVKEAFVALLATGYSPTRAAGEVGVSRQAAYRQRSNDPDFAEAWQEALQQQADLYEDALRKAALDQHNIGGIIFGLKNLRPAKWRDRHEIERWSVNANVNVTAQLSPAQAEALARVIARRSLDEASPPLLTEGTPPALLTEGTPSPDA